MTEFRLGLLFALWASPAFAADWLLVWSGREEAVMLDRASVRRGGGAAQAWVMKVFDKTVTLDDGSVPHRSRRIHLVADCRAGKYGYDEQVFLSGAQGTGTVVRNEKPAAVDMVVPATAPEKILFAMVCNS